MATVSVPLPLPQLSTCKMKNNGIPLPLRNIINALSLLKHLLFSDGECKIIEDEVPCEKKLSVFKKFSIAIILLLRVSFS